MHPPSPNTVFALLIGAGASATKDPLPQASLGARALASVLRHHLGVPKDNIRCLPGEEATLEATRTGLKWLGERLFDKAADGSRPPTGLFYFCGHGYRDGSLKASDTTSSGSSLGFGELCRTFAFHGPRVLLLVDSCYSGEITTYDAQVLQTAIAGDHGPRSSPESYGAFPAEKAADQILPPGIPIIEGRLAQRAVFAATAPDQSAHVVSIGDTSPMAFTYHLLQGLLGLWCPGDAVTAQTLGGILSAMVPRTVWRWRRQLQTPVCTTRGPNFPLFDRACDDPQEAEGIIRSVLAEAAKGLPGDAWDTNARSQLRPYQYFVDAERLRRGISSEIARTLLRKSARQELASLPAKPSTDLLRLLAEIGLGTAPPDPQDVRAKDASPGFQDALAALAQPEGQAVELSGDSATNLGALHRSDPLCAAVSTLALGRVGEANQYLNTLMEGDVGIPFPQQAVGLLRFTAGNAFLAEDACVEALRRTARGRWEADVANLLLGVIRASRRDWKTAREHLDALSPALVTRQPRVLQLRSRIRALTTPYSHGKASYRDVLDDLNAIESKDATDHYWCGLAHLAQGDHDQAAAAFQRSLEHGPRRAEGDEVLDQPGEDRVRERLVSSLAASGKLEEAGRAAAELPDGPYRTAADAAIALARGEFARADTLFAKALEDWHLPEWVLARVGARLNNSADATLASIYADTEEALKAANSLQLDIALTALKWETCEQWAGHLRELRGATRSIAESRVSEAP